MNRPYPVEINPQAAAMMLAALKEESGKTGVRIGVLGGGCSGLQYSLDFYEEVGENDIAYEQWGLKVVVDMYSAMHLEGTVISYESTGISQGFKFNNPNAQRTCGCGSSFQT